MLFLGLEDESVSDLLVNRMEGREAGWRDPEERRAEQSRAHEDRKKGSGEGRGEEDEEVVMRSVWRVGDTTSHGLVWLGHLPKPNGNLLPTYLPTTIRSCVSIL